MNDGIDGIVLNIMDNGAMMSNRNGHYTKAFLLLFYNGIMADKIRHMTIITTVQ